MPEASSITPAWVASEPSWSLAKTGTTWRWDIPKPPKEQDRTMTVSSTGVFLMTDRPFMKF